MTPPSITLVLVHKQAGPCTQPLFIVSVSPTACSARLMVLHSLLAFISAQVTVFLLSHSANTSCLSHGLHCSFCPGKTALPFLYGTNQELAATGSQEETVVDCTYLIMYKSHQPYLLLSYYILPEVLYMTFFFLLLLHTHLSRKPS